MTLRSFDWSSCTLCGESCSKRSSLPIPPAHLFFGFRKNPATWEHGSTCEFSLARRSSAAGHSWGSLARLRLLRRPAPIGGTNRNNQKSSAARSAKNEQIMAIELKVPEVGESITEVEIGGWLKSAGQPVRKDEPVVTLESEKATVELAAPDSGTLSQVLKQKGEMARIGEVIGYVETSAPAQTEPEKPRTQAVAPKAEPNVEAK